MNLKVYFNFQLIEIKSFHCYDVTCSCWQAIIPFFKFLVKTSLLRSYFRVAITFVIWYVNSLICIFLSTGSSPWSSGYVQFSDNAVIVW